MARTVSSVLTPAEVEIMNVLWRIPTPKKGVSVSFLHRSLNKSGKKRHYNTILTIVRILERKGFVKHSKVKGERGYAFYAISSLNDERNRAIKQFCAQYGFSNRTQLTQFLRA